MDYKKNEQSLCNVGGGVQTYHYHDYLSDPV